MPDYLIAFQEEWVPELTEEQLMDRARALKPLIAEMEDAGVWVFGGGLDQESPVFSIDLVDGNPVRHDGPYAETKEHLGGFCVVRVDDIDQALAWAEKVAVGCGWPQQVHEFMPPPQV